MPMREMVAGEAQLRSWVSNRKLTLGPNWILSPLGIVSKRLSSSTEFNDSIHSGSMSPSHIIHELTSERDRMTSEISIKLAFMWMYLCSLSECLECVLSALMHVFEGFMCLFVVCQVFCCIVVYRYISKNVETIFPNFHWEALINLQLSTKQML